jgi:hypothetical protein
MALCGDAWSVKWQTAKLPNAGDGTPEPQCRRARNTRGANATSPADSSGTDVVGELGQIGKNRQWAIWTNAWTAAIGRNQGPAAAAVCSWRSASAGADICVVTGRGRFLILFLCLAPVRCALAASVVNVRFLFFNFGFCDSLSPWFDCCWSAVSCRILTISLCCCVFVGFKKDGGLFINDLAYFKMPGDDDGFAAIHFFHFLKSQLSGIANLALEGRQISFPARNFGITVSDLRLTRRRAGGSRCASSADLIISSHCDGLSVDGYLESESIRPVEIPSAISKIREYLCRDCPRCPESATVQKPGYKRSFTGTLRTVGHPYSTVLRNSISISFL